MVILHFEKWRSLYEQSRKASGGKMLVFGGLKYCGEGSQESRIVQGLLCILRTENSKRVIAQAWEAK